MAKLYYPTPDELRGARPLNEQLWFPRFQSTLLRLANTNEGRDLLCLDSWQKRPYPITALEKNRARYSVGKTDNGHTYVSDVRVGAKWGNIIRYRWQEIAKAMDRIDMIEMLKVWPRMTLMPDGRYAPAIMGRETTTVFPDPDPETTTVDGSIQERTASETFSTKRDKASGTGVADSAAQVGWCNLRGSTGSWNELDRGVHLFDASAIADGDTVDSAIFSFVCYALTTGDMAFRLVTCTPASNTGLVVEDYDQFGTVAQAPDLDDGSINADDSTYNDMTLNSTGRGNISLTGVTKFANRPDADADNSEPSTEISVNCRNADNTGTSADPKLAVTHTTPFSNLSGVGIQLGAVQPLMMPTSVVPY